MSDRNLRINLLFAAADKVTKPLRDIAGGSIRASEALKTTRDQLKGLERAQTQVQDFRALRSGLRDTATELKVTRSRIVELRTAIGSVDTPTKKMTNELARAEAAAGRLETTQRRQAASLRTSRAAFRESGVSVRNLTAHEQRLGTEIADTTRRLDDQTRRLHRMSNAREGFTSIQDRASGLAAGGAASLATAVAVGTPIVGAAKGAMDLEEGMAGVAKVTGMAGGQLSAMQDKIVTLSTKIPMTAVELSNIAAAAGAAGVGMDKFGKPLPSQADDLVAFTDAAARMGIAFDMTAEDAGGTMAKWRQAFKMTQPEVEGLGDRINALTNKFGGNASSVAGIVTRIGPLGKVAGIAAAEISAMASSLNSIGVEEEIAATGIKNTLLTLTKGTAATKTQSAALKALGLDAVKVSKAMQVNASGTIVDVLERIKRLRVDKQASALSELFGTESVGAIAPLLTNLDGLKQRLGLVGTVSQYAGSMTNEFLSRINTTTGATDIAANAFQAANLTLGQSLLPTIKEGALRLTAITLRMRAFAARHPQLARGAMLATGTLAVLFGLFGVGAIAVAGLMGPIAIINAGLIAMGVNGGLASIGLLPIIGAVAAVVAGVAALAGAAYLIYSNWGAITGFFGNLWSGIQTHFASASATVTGIFQSMWSGVKAIFSTSMLDIVRGIGFGLGYALGALYRFGAVAFGWLTGRLPGLLSAGWNAAWSMLTGAIGASWTWLTTRLPAMLANGWAMAWTAFKAAVQAAFITLPTMFANFGVMIVKGLWNGIKSAPAALWNAGAKLANSLSGGFRKGADIHSPSRVFRTLGGHVMRGLTLGLAAGERGPLDRIARLTSDMTAAFAPDLAYRLPDPPAALPLPAGEERSNPARALPAMLAALRLPTPIVPAVQAAPALRLDTLSQQIMAALAIGSATPAVAAPNPPTTSTAAAAPTNSHYEIHIHATPGMDEQALARAVAAELDRRDREKGAAARSAFVDRPDWN